MFECEECSSLKFSEEEKAHGILKNLLVGDESEEGSSVLMKVAAVKEMISSFNWAKNVVMLLEVCDILYYPNLRVLFVFVFMIVVSPTGQTRPSQEPWMRQIC